jgi:hypothetical protein
MSTLLSDGSVWSNGSDPSVRTNSALSSDRTDPSNGSDRSDPSDGSTGPDRLRLAEAAVFLGVSVTTVKRYISEGRLSYVQERGPTGHKLHLIPRGDLARLRDEEQTAPSDPNRSIGPTCPTDPTDRIRRTEPTGPTEPPDRMVPMDRTDRSDPQGSIRVMERERDLLREERDRLIGDVHYLRAQLEQRAEEVQRHAIAEEQLRVMLMKLEATNAVMTGALVQKALPAPEEETPRRTRWWALWGRGSG